MSSQPLSARLRYLNDSSHLLATSAPRTSAFLMSKCDSLMFDNDLDPPNSHRRETCGACGNILLLGVTATIQLDKIRNKMVRAGKDKPKVRSTAQPNKVVAYDCKICGRQTRQQVNAPTRRAFYNSRKGTFPRSMVVENGGNVSLPVKIASSRLLPSSERNTSSPANVSSRHRARVRKQGGLQALLAKRKESDSLPSKGGFGLDLLDLMRKA